ncbi:MAG: hypothetical protein Q7J10_03135 [Methanosarcinaceae archaeon]|nr:hypothetical protein [Methanosarcinaceae archaeon]
MKHGHDFSWKTNKPILDYNMDTIIPVLSESLKEVIMKNESQNKNEEIDQLISAFKRRLSDIISKEE